MTPKIDSNQYINDAHQDLLPFAEEIGMKIQIKIRMQNAKYANFHFQNQM